MEGRAEGIAPEGGGAASGCRAGVAWRAADWEREARRRRRSEEEMEE